MSFEIIGSGFGRTETMSTMIALEQPGFGPCHHMVEVMGNPDQPAHWNALAAGENVDWSQVVAGYRSQVDFPGATYWPDILPAFAEAKVIHTGRPEYEWWASYSKTIGKFFMHYKSLPVPPSIIEMFDTMEILLVDDVFGGDDERKVSASRGWFDAAAYARQVTG